jgi:hypothetical protein
MTDADLNAGALEPTPSWLKPAPAPAPVAPPAPAPVAPAPAPAPTTYSSPTTYSAPTTQAWSGFLGGAAPTDTQKAYAQSKGVSFDQAAYELSKSQTNNTTTYPTQAPTTSNTSTTTGTGLQGQAPSEQVKEYAVQKGISFDQAYNELASSGKTSTITGALSQNKVQGTDIAIPNVLNDVNFNTGKTGNLTDKQKSELQIAWDRASAGNANQEDYNNLKNAIENLGWKPTTTTDAARIASEKAAADKIAADKAAADAAAAATAKSFQDKIDATNKALDENYTKITNLIDSLAKGTIALTANQQTLIDSIQTNLVKAIAAQKTANANYEAGLTQAGIAAGRNRYAPEIEMGNIYNAINLGASKINDLDAAAVAKKAELMEQFQTNNYQNALSGYKELQSILKDKEDSIIKLEQMSRDYAKDQAAIAYKAQQDAITNKISLIDKGYEPISDITGLTPDQYVKVGNEYFKKPATTVDATNDIKEYEYAKTTGAYKGTFMDYLVQKANLKETKEYEPTDAAVLARAKDLMDKDVSLSNEEAYNIAREQLISEHGGGKTSIHTTGEGMRTDRHYNPIAVATTAGKTNEFTNALDDAGIEWSYGDIFGDGAYQTIKFNNAQDGIEGSRVILANTGAIQNWYINHTGKDILNKYEIKNNEDFSKASKEIQDKIIQGIYSKEGGSGSIFETKTTETPKEENIWSGVSKDKQTSALKINTDFENEPAVKDYVTIKNQYDSIKDIPATPNAAEAQQIINTFAKIMDPTSSIKSEEYKSVKEYQTALITRFASGIKKIFTTDGGLTPEAVEQMKGVMGSKAKSFEGMYSTIRNQKAKQIDQVVGKPIGAKALTDYGTVDYTPTTQVQKNDEPKSIFEKIFKPSTTSTVEDFRTKYNY